MKFILGKKMGMTQVFRPDGAVVPVTVVKAGPCQITQVKGGKGEEQPAVQIGFGEVREFRLGSPRTGHLKGLRPVGFLKDFLIEKTDGLERGDEITCATFASGDRVEVIGISKGRGFAGVVKRHHFAGGPASHGHKDNLRAPGSIGAGGVQRVFKGMRMAGRMGGERVTVKNLEIIEVHPEANELLVKGALPGGRNGFLMIIGEGDLKVNKAAAPTIEEPKIEAVPSSDGIQAENEEKKD